MSAFKSLFLFLLLWPSLVCAQLSVFVSVLPHKMIVERVGADRVKVNVMVGKGFNPAIYQPSPRQIGALADAQIYLTAGVPFEKSWLPRFKSANPRMQVFELNDGIDVLPVAGHNHAADGQFMDPHIWTDPLLLIRQALRVRDLLQQKMPAHAQEMELNYQQLKQELEHLDQEIHRQLDGLQQRSFLVFHPAWGYFARRYELQQVAAELDGKEPNARQLARLIEQAQQQGIDRVIIQPQNKAKTARTLAEAINGKIVLADPLAEDYFTSLRDFARLLGAVND